MRGVTTPPFVTKLAFDNIEKRFSGVPVINGFSRDIVDGELVALVGPFGCCRSTLLHIAAGLEQPSADSVLGNGRRVRDPDPQRTLISQENALHP